MPPKETSLLPGEVAHPQQISIAEGQRNADFLAWVQQLYGDHARLLCEQRAQQACAEDGSFDPATVLEKSTREQNATLLRMFEEINARPFHIDLELE